MGRPINKKYIGDIANPGQQLAATAYFTGLGGTSQAWIASQHSLNTYTMVSACGAYTDIVQLTDGGVALQPGQANITVQPYGSTGSGATATANLGIGSATVVNAGTGTTANGYAPGQILSMNGGTYTGNQRGNVRVSTVQLGAATASSTAGYTVGDTFTWSAAGWNSPTVLTVASTTGNGVIGGLTITSAGCSSSTSITNTIAYSSSVTTNAWATSATFKLRWDITELGVYNTGDYTAPPSNPVSFTPQSGHGTGATATIAYGISSTKVTAAGSNYQAVKVCVSGCGGAIVYANINACGQVASLNVAAPGTFGPTRPTLAINTVDTPQYAEVVKNLTVTTFAYNTYEWVPTGCTAQPGQAVIQTA
jgi:hypothetical protein